jgi:hypothetical protein
VLAPIAIIIAAFRIEGWQQLISGRPGRRECVSGVFGAARTENPVAAWADHTDDSHRRGNDDLGHREPAFRVCARLGNIWRPARRDYDHAFGYQHFHHAALDDHVHIYH